MPGLRRDAGVGKQLFERNELVALLTKNVDGLKCGLDTRVIWVVQENDVAAFGIFDDVVRDEVPVAHAPIHRVDRPVDERDGDGTFECVACKAPGWAQPVVTVAEDGAQRLVRFLDFRECSGVSAVKTDVRVAVAADLMAFVFHAADEIFVARDLLADEEERRVRAALLEPVEQSCGRLRGRAVVKGQRNAAPQLGWGRDGDSLAVFSAGKAEGKKSQQKQQQERETSFQDHHLSLYFTQQADKKDQPV